MERAPEPQRRALSKYYVDLCVAALRVAVGVGFIAASIPKIERPYDFLGIVYDYSLVGPGVGLTIAKTIPWLELIIGACLVTRVLEEGALLCGAVLLLVFTIAESLALHRGFLIPCGCFSVDVGTPIEWKHVIMTGSLAILTTILLATGRRRGPTAHASSGLSYPWDLPPCEAEKPT